MADIRNDPIQLALPRLPFAPKIAESATVAFPSTDLTPSEDRGFPPIERFGNNRGSTEVGRAQASRTAAVE